MYNLFPGLSKVKQSFIADQRIDRLELKGSSGANFLRRKKIRWIEHTWIPPRATMRISRAAKSVSFFFFSLFVHTFIYSIPSRTSLIRIRMHPHNSRLPAASRIVESFKIFTRHDPLSKDIVTFEICVLLANESTILKKTMASSLSCSIKMNINYIINKCKNIQ